MVAATAVAVATQGAKVKANCGSGGGDGGRLPAHAVDKVREGEPVRRVPPAPRRLVRRIHGGVGVAVCREPQEPSAFAGAKASRAAERRTGEAGGMCEKVSEGHLSPGRHHLRGRG